MGEPREWAKSQAKNRNKGGGSDKGSKDKGGASEAARPFKMGRNRPVAKGPMLKFRDYLLKGLPTPPSSCDYSKPAMAALSNVYMNDTLGCCTISGLYHIIATLTGNSAGQPFVASNEDIIQTYSACGGYVPGDPSTDQGCDEVTVLNYWLATGAPVGANKILGYLAVDPTDMNQVRTAMWMFENLYSGLELPDAWTQNMPQESGFTWDVAGPPDPNEGHCIIGTGYTPAGVLIDTWGLIGTMTNAAVQQYWGEADGGDLYVVISQELVNKATQKAPNGFDFTQLVADFDSMGGNVKQPNNPVVWPNIFAAKA